MLNSERWPVALAVLFLSTWASLAAPVQGQAPPVRMRMRFASTTHVGILQSIPGMRKVDGFTVGYGARNADAAYRLIRLLYRFVRQ
ncbi:MAG: hypothetical protein U5R14_06840 [Gemmatimonadota bacterium]|nr:hypothetical protein [Gemmatimonadota bacterium]